MTSHTKSISLVIACSWLFAGCTAGSLPMDEDADVAESESAHSAACPEPVPSGCPATVPSALVPPADQTITTMLNAVGVQVYMCNGAASGPIWTFVAPQANLLTDNGNLIGTHFIGPTWQGNDLSSVVGAKVAGASVDATAVPWLLLSAASHSEESGIFQDVTYIQRLNTVGGLAPTTGCDAEHLGTIAQVPYSAEYVFYKPKGRGKVKQCGT